MYKVIVLGITGLFLSGCMSVMEPTMSSVMSSCESRSEFTSYVSCIKTNYKRYPNHSVTKSMYAQLDALVEEYEGATISQTKAMSEAYIIYDNTWGAENRSISANAAASSSSYRAPMTCTTYGNTTNCY
jgi:hypothetical protein